MLHTLSKVDAELAVSGVMHADHRALSLTSIAHPAGDARRVAEACQSLAAGLVDRPPTVDRQRFVLPLSPPAGGDPAGRRREARERSPRPRGPPVWISSAVANSNE